MMTCQGFPAHSFPVPTPNRQPLPLLLLPLQMLTRKLKGIGFQPFLLCNLVHVSVSLTLLENEKSWIRYS